MNIVLLDDDSTFLKQEKEIVEKILAMHDFEASIYDFTSQSEFFKSMDERKYDLILLDIDMPERNGLEIANFIRETRKESFIAFVSSHEQFMYDSLNLFPISFVIKKDVEQRLQIVLSHVISLKEKNDKRICFKVDGENLMFTVSDIIYAESMKAHIILHTTTQEYQFRKKISDFESELSSFNFLKPHKCYVVNFDHIKAVLPNCLKMSNNDIIPISKYRYKDFNAEFNTLMRRKW